MKTSNPGQATESLVSTVPAIILAGGLGTRLRSAYSGPKCMAPVHGRPFLEFVISSLRRSGISEVVLCVGYKRSHIQRHFARGRRFGIQILYSVESKLLGTAGALVPAWQLSQSACAFVVNGDTYLDVNLGEMLRFHRQHNAIATLALAEIGNASRYGTVRIDSDSRITGFFEKDSNSPSEGLINAGVYLLSSEVVKRIPHETAVSLEKEIFPDLIGSRFFGFVTKGAFLDIGIPEDFRRAPDVMPQGLS